MKILLNTGQITTVTREKGAELIASGAGVEYTGQDPEEIRTREALAVPEKAAEKIEVVHRYIVEDQAQEEPEEKPKRRRKKKE